MSKKDDKTLQQIVELTDDLQRLRADFENYRKRVDTEKEQLRELTKAATIMKLLPVIDTIERAASHIPPELADNTWAKGVVGLGRNLEKSLGELDLQKVQAAPGTTFDPHLHEAVSVDDGEGDLEVIAEELRSGYLLGGTVIRHSMVKVTRQ